MRSPKVIGPVLAHQRGSGRRASPSPRGQVLAASEGACHGVGPGPQEGAGTDWDSRRVPRPGGLTPAQQRAGRCQCHARPRRRARLSPLANATAPHVSALKTRVRLRGRHWHMRDSERRTRLCISPSPEAHARGCEARPLTGDPHCHPPPSTEKFRPFERSRVGPLAQLVGRLCASCLIIVMTRLTIATQTFHPQWSSDERRMTQASPQKLSVQQ